MTNARKTLVFFSVTDLRTRNAVLDNIANHYGIDRAAALDEVTEADAESLLDYITGPERAATHALMHRHGLA